MENLPLRKDALRNLGLPLQALKGIVGKIKLQIPVRQFRSAPWCIFIEDVYIVVGPVNLDEVFRMQSSDGFWIMRAFFLVIITYISVGCRERGTSRIRLQIIAIR